MMPENTGNNVNLPNGNLNAGRDIELVGGNQVKIANNTHNLNLFQVSERNSLSELFSILETNRKSLDHNLSEVKKHFSSGGNLLDTYGQAIIVDAISESRIIESLIVAIKGKGGDAKTLNEEVNMVARIENIIALGKKEYLDAIEIARKEKEIRDREALLGCIGGIFIAIWNGIVWLYEQITEKMENSNKLPNNPNDTSKSVEKQKQWWE